MKRFVFFISTFLSLTLTVSAQNEFEKKIEWQTFSPDSEEFSVEVPLSLNFYSFDSKNENRRYTGQSGRAYFFIFSDFQKNDFQYKTVLKFVERYKLLELARQKSSATMSFAFSDTENFYHKIYIAKSNDRSYVFHVVSEIVNDPNSERFFKSLKINDLPASVNFVNDISEKTSEIVNQAKSIDNQENKKSEKSIPASDIGNGQGYGLGNGNQKVSPNSEKENAIIKVLNLTSKPKPQYNDFARFYDIIGNVKVRITFLKDGTIGSVVPMTKLPFGLTQASVETAKKIRFEPQTVNGQSVSVTKVVVFNFTIY